MPATRRPRRSTATACTLCALLTASAAAQSLELELVTHPSAPGWAAIDFRQHIVGSNDTWLAAELRNATTHAGATFRYIPTSTPQAEPLYGHLLPDRPQDGASLAEQFTTFLNLPAADPADPDRFSTVRVLAWAGEYAATACDHLLAGQDPRLNPDGDIPRGVAGYFARVAITLPPDADPDRLYVDHARRESWDRVLAAGRMDWGTQSTVDAPGADPSRSTHWVIAEAVDAPDTPPPADPGGDPAPGDPNAADPGAPDDPADPDDPYGPDAPDLGGSGGDDPAENPAPPGRTSGAFDDQLADLADDLRRQAGDPDQRPAHAPGDGGRPFPTGDDSASSDDEDDTSDLSDDPSDNQNDGAPEQDDAANPGTDDSSEQEGSDAPQPVSLCGFGVPFAGLGVPLAGLGLMLNAAAHARRPRRPQPSS